MFSYVVAQTINFASSNLTRPENCVEHWQNRDLKTTSQKATVQKNKLHQSYVCKKRYVHDQAASVIKHKTINKKLNYLTNKKHQRLKLKHAYGVQRCIALYRQYLYILTHSILTAKLCFPKKIFKDSFQFLLPKHDCLVKFTFCSS